MRNVVKYFNSPAFILNSLIICFVFSGCVVGPRYEAPVLEMPPEWNSEISAGMRSESPDCFFWWESLNDPLLNYLIEQAAVSNLDLYIAATRILEARVEWGGGKASRYPHLDGSAGYGHARYNRKMLSRALCNACSEKPHGSEVRNINFFEVGFDADWEIDLFGMRAHEIKALKARIESSEEDFCYIWMTLSAEIAKNYIELRGLQMHLGLIEKNVETQIETTKLTEDLVLTGFTTLINQRRAEELWNTLVSQKPQIELLIDKSIHRLSILLGFTPGELFAVLGETDCLPTLPCQKPIGVPSELLRRRPDIRRAERDLAATTESIGSAVAALFPRLSLRGFIGNISALCSGSFTWLAGPQLLLPIFNSRSLEQDVYLNKIKAQQALYEYQKIVLNALEEVENALVSYRSELERSDYLMQAQQASQEAYTLTVQLYEQGFKNYLEVLTMHRSLISVQETFLESQVELLLQYIALYKALGGGWEGIDCRMDQS